MFAAILPKQSWRIVSNLVLFAVGVIIAEKAVWIAWKESEDTTKPPVSLLFDLCSEMGNGVLFPKI